MNKTENKLNFRTLLTLLMILMLSLVLAFATSCGDDSDTSDSTSTSESTSESETDSQTINNGDFEFYTTSSSTYPVSTSSTKWTKKTESNVFSAPTSTSSSGIIDTSDEAFEKLADSNKPKDSEDKPVNPGTPAVDPNDDTQVNEAGTKILMIHNAVSGSPSKGTAQYFTSASTITLAPSECAKISVWVRTDNLKSIQGGDFGAYIKIANTVSSSIEPLIIKNINTESEWINYIFFLKPSDTAVTKYCVTLGLGMGDKVNTAELCEGFAFFDNVEYTVIDPADYDNAVENVGSEVCLYNATNNYVLDKEDTANYDKSAFTVSEAGISYGTDARIVKMNFAKTVNSYDVSTGSGSYNSVNPNSTGNAVSEYDAGYTATAITSIIGSAESTKLEVPANSIYMNFKGQKIGSSYSYSTADITLDGKKYMKFSFDVKASSNSSTTNASATIIDGGENSSTGIFSSFTTDDVKNEYNDDYIRYTFYIVNNYTDATTFSIKFSFGPEKMADSALALPVGYAIFTNFKSVELTKSEYTSADVSNDSHAVKVALLGSHTADNPEDSEDEEDAYEEINESYSFYVADASYPTLEHQAVEVGSSYTQVVNTEEAVAGVVNSYYANNYTATYGTDVTTALQNLESKQYLGNNNKHVQPYMIYNKVASSNGLIVTPVTIPAYTTYSFSVKVYATSSATAYIYLVDATIDDSLEDGDSVDYSINQFNIPDNDTAYNMQAVISNATCNSDANLDGYVYVMFVIQTGKDAVDLRLELWNGSRDSNNKSTGAVFFDFISNGSTASYTDFNSLKADYEKVNFDEVSYQQEKIYSYYDEYDEENPNYVLDDDGEKVFTIGEVNTVYAKSSNSARIQYYRYDTFNQYNIVESESDEEESAEESVEESTSVDNNQIGNLVWLQIASIIIAAVLILALVAIIVRKLVERSKKRKAKTQSYYAGYDARNARYSKKSSVETPDEDEGDYDYDNPENNIKK